MSAQWAYSQQTAENATLFQLVIQKIIFVALCLGVAVAALPLQQQQHRLTRDVSEIVAAEPAKEYLPPAPVAAESLKSIYLPPVESVGAAEPVPVVAEESSPDTRETNAAEEAEVVEAATEAVPETAVFGENGYEYRTVRKLRLRQRRDVSHLNLGYLPPVANLRLPSTYLPPQLDVPQELPQLKISNEYLPPVNEELVSEEPTTEAVDTEAPETEVPTTEAPSTREAMSVETAVFADDGYHYKKPAVSPDLGMEPLVKVAEPDTAPDVPEGPVAPESQPESVEAAEVESALEPEQQPAVEQTSEEEQINEVEPELAYLPPLEPGVVEAQGPGQETSALLDDGYHYRAVKRVRFF
ncbi:periaxin-like [Anastrepha ludens]|uniref:periaxin-like n=1 Tax=Anastrepha ludens TaxID=28586 RepID=UPI0023AE7B04|nr:periaxin-like [Anastrepha ludens]